MGLKRNEYGYHWDRPRKADPKEYRGVNISPKKIGDDYANKSWKVKSELNVIITQK